MTSNLDLLEVKVEILLEALSQVSGKDFKTEVEKVIERKIQIEKEEAKEKALLEEMTSKPKNQLRRELIEEAKNLFNDLIVDNEHRYVYSFKVDEDKRTVRLVRLEVEFDEFGETIYTGKVLKKVAVADEEDVFNADIGKAILIGSMHGVDVSKFTDAVQPDKVVVGMDVLSNETYTVNGEFVFFGDKLTVTGNIPRNKRECQINSMVSDSATILSDTYACYYTEFE